MNVWLDGSLVPAEHAAVHATDHGITVGDGVFETVKVENGIPFAITRHLHRLAASASALDLPVPATVREAVAAVCAEVADHPTARLRITVTGGPGPAGYRRGPRPTLLVVATPYEASSAPESLAGVPWRRNEFGALTGVKTTSYAENVRMLAAAQRAGAGEALVLNTGGFVCEGTGSNLWAVLDGVPVTPPLSSGCLAGVTRALVLAWCPEAVERALTPEDLSRAQEVFLTSTTRDVQAVAAIDGVRPGGADAAVPGPVTARIATTFAALAAEDPDPA
ncbi:MAG: aminotransferase class IV [Sporichthyaceae bacterium]